jgi:hypothetical protein
VQSGADNGDVGWPDVMIVPRQENGGSNDEQKRRDVPGRALKEKKRKGKERASCPLCHDTTHCCSSPYCCCYHLRILVTVTVPVDVLTYIHVMYMWELPSITYHEGRNLHSIL